MQDGLVHKDIDGFDYGFEKFGADESLDTLLVITKIAGKPFGSAVAAFAGSKEEGGAIRPDMLSMVFESLTEKLDVSVVKGLIKKLTSEKVLCDGKKITFNTHYQDKLAHMFKVLYAALEVQYGNFFGEIIGLVAERKAPITNLTVTA